MRLPRLLPMEGGLGGGCDQVLNVFLVFFSISRRTDLQTNDVEKQSTRTFERRLELARLSVSSYTRDLHGRSDSATSKNRCCIVIAVRSLAAPIMP